ncbi:hypothetical protein PU463_00016110 [Pseudomonas aeruginosa]
MSKSTKNLNDALARADVRKEVADLVKGIQATPTSGTQTSVMPPRPRPRLATP